MAAPKNFKPRFTCVGYSKNAAWYAAQRPNPPPKSDWPKIWPCPNPVTVRGLRCADCIRTLRMTFDA